MNNWTLTLLISFLFSSISFCYEKEGDIPDSVIFLLDSVSNELSKKHNVNLKLEKITDKQSNRKIKGWIFAYYSYQLAGVKQYLDIEVKDNQTVLISKGRLLILSIVKRYYPDLKLDVTTIKKGIFKNLKFIRKLKIIPDKLYESSFDVNFYDKRFKESFSARFFIGLIDTRSDNYTHVVNIHLGEYDELVPWDFDFPSRLKKIHKLAFVLQTNEPPPNRMIISHIYLFDICTFDLRAMYSTCVYNTHDVITGP